MGASTRVRFVSLGVIICLAGFGCGQDDPAARRDDLPDLNKQMRPYITIESTKVRTGPGPQFKTTGEIPSRARVHVVGRDGDWVLIVSKRGNIPGFIERSSVQPGGDERDSADPVSGGKYEMLANTRVHVGPGLHYPVITEIAKGTIVNVVEEEKGWLKIESRRGNKPGYVDASLAKPAPEQ